MRWFVEISPLGKPEAEPDRECVEASHWQEAIKGVRRATGLDDALRNFSIEVLDDGIRAVDPMSRKRYVILRAPDDAPLTGQAASQAPPASQEPPAPAAETKPASAPPPAGKKRLAQTMMYGSPGSAEISEAVKRAQAQLSAPSASQGPPAYTRAVLPPQASEPAPQPAVQPQAQPQAPVQPVAPVQPQITEAPVSKTEPPESVPDTEVQPPAFAVVASREEEPSKASPLTYREYAYAIPEGSTEDDAEKFIVERFKEIRENLASTQSAKLVNLAVFDHEFKRKPKRPPLVTLVWKDWKGDPEVRFTSRPGVSIPPPSLGKGPPASMPPAEAPKPSQPPQAQAQPVQQEQPAQPPKQPQKQPVHTPPSTPAAIRKKHDKHGPLLRTMRSAESPAESGAPEAKPRVVAQQAAPAPAARAPATPKPVSSDEIIADIFESMHDLHFLRDAYEGADFVIALALDKMRCKLGIAQLYDINRREFVVAHAVGPGADNTLGNRTSEHDPMLAEIMNRRTPFVIDASKDPRFREGRWEHLGGEPTAVLACAVAQGGRFLGIIEIAHTAAEGAFRKADIDGLAYIAESFAEFVAKTGLMFGSEKNLMPQ